MRNSFPKIVKDILKKLPSKDYPVLNTSLFVSYWIGYSLDKSLTSMRDLFKRLNNTGFKADISTFSKASKQRSIEPFIKIYSNRQGDCYKRGEMGEMGERGKMGKRDGEERWGRRRRLSNRDDVSTGVATAITLFCHSPKIELYCFWRLNS